MMADIWSTNYLAYCSSQGREPDEQMRHDGAQWPGGVMVGFISWIHDQLQAYKAGGGDDRDHRAFAAWLRERFVAVTAEVKGEMKG